MSKNKFHKLFIIFLITLFFLIIGFFSIRYLDSQKEKSILSDLSILTKTVAYTIDPSHFYTLTADPSDKEKPDFISLRQQLIKAAPQLTSKGIRWIYTVVKKNANYIFLVDSIDENDSAYSPPGDVYNNPPSELKIVFETNQAITSKVYTDDWGQFISVFVPVQDPKTKEILAVLGADIDYSFFKSEIIKTRLFAIGIIFLIWIISILVYLFLLTRYQEAINLKESEEKFHSITEFVFDPIVMVDKNGSIVLWNKAAEKNYGYSQVEVVGKNLYRLIVKPSKHTTNNSKDINTFHRISQSLVFGQVLELETVSKTGKIIPIEISLSSIKIKGQAYMIGVIRNISSRKENEQSQLAILNVLEDIKEEKSKTEALFSSIGDGVIATGTDSKIIYANQAVEKLLGWKPSELVGKLFYKIIPVSDIKNRIIPKNRRGFYVVLKTGQIFHSTHESATPLFYIRKDKTKLPINATVTPIKIDGKIIGAINVFKDVAREIEIDRMKTEFISLASHQLRTPLSAIKWFSEMLLAGDAGKLLSEQKEYISNISISNERMIDLVNSLLNISRIESGRIIVDPKPTDLGELVRSVLKEIDNKIQDKKQKVIISIHSSLPKINIDPKLISEVYKNLLTNANKYTPEGGEIYIFISKKDKEIVSQITDNGYGIPKASQPKIFEKFYRAENIVKIITEGTGLGLYLAKAIVESSSGKIWFTSQEKKGTTFWFTLPISGVKTQKGQVTINS